MEWFKKHKFITVIIVLVLIVAIAGAGGGGEETTNTNSSNSSESASSNNNEKTYKFEDRADKQASDVEVLPGESATVDGVQMTLSNVEYKTSLGEYETAEDGKTFVIADVALENTSEETKAYNVFNFRIQTSGGQVLDGAFTTLSNTLGSGDLVTGGKTSGKIAFEVPVEEGHQYVIWKPNAVRSDRAVVQVR